MVHTSQLAQLATIANDAHRNALPRAIEAGQALIDAKRLLKHGEWLPWLKANCVFSERTARVYMQVARNPKSAVGADSIDAIVAASAKTHDKRYAHELKVLAEKFGTLKRHETIRAAVKFAYDIVYQERCRERKAA
jgi:hypothetical protein